MAKFTPVRLPVIPLKIAAMSTPELIYDDEKAAAFIKSHLPKELQKKYSDENIQYVLDLLYEFYESAGAIIEEDDENTGQQFIDLDHEEMIEFLRDALEEDAKAEEFPMEDIELILQAELEYCKSIGIVDQDEE